MPINKDSSLEDFKKMFKIKPAGHYAKWRIISILAGGFIVVSALFIGHFVYQNIYTTLSNTDAIIVLESGLNVDAIDSKAYNQVEEKLASKKTFFVWPDKIRNIFEYVTTTTTTSSIITPKI